jgi:FdhE protein
MIRSTSGVSAIFVMKKIEWDKRIQRALDLAQRYPSASEILGFYRYILKFQKTLCDGVSSLSPPADGGQQRFRELLDVEIATRHLPALLSLVQGQGPSKLAREAAELSRSSWEEQRQICLSFLFPADDNEQVSKCFFARVLFQPYAEMLAQTWNSQSPDSARSVCPVCSARPQVAVLRPEGDGGKRFLVCSFCLTEWEYRRILCPMCGEVDHQKLPRYSAEDMTAVRVEACDTCKYYLKSVDMTVDGLAVPLVDEVASAPLDIWAMEHRFNKISSNLMGF